MNEQNEAAQTSWPEQHPLLTSTVGYGIICGLTFPLMISSTFLKEMSLSHGAGNSFGALFFIAYALTMLATAGLHLFHRKPVHRTRMASAFVAAFLGNALMLVRYWGLIPGDWLYAICAAGLIGYGLATAELGWMARIAALHSEGRLALARALPLSFGCGAVTASVIFLVSGTVELGFALAVIVISALPFLRRQTLESADRRISFAHAGAADFIKAVSYLAVFSFVFGAVSQVATRTDADLIPIETQAVLGIALAAGIMFLGSLRTSKRKPMSDLYNLLFPIVAIALIALPFITSPALHLAANVLVFVAYYLSGINARIIISELATRDRVSLWVYLGIALGVGSLLILAGVAFGSNVLAHENPLTSLALVSLVSLFVLALNPLIAARLEQRSARRFAAPYGATRFADETLTTGENQEGSHANNSVIVDELAGDSVALGEASQPEGQLSPGGANRAAQLALMRQFSKQHGFTPREAEVLELLCQGRTRTYIAAELGLSPNTVKGYIHNVYQKSGAVDKQDLIDRVEMFCEKH